MSSNFSRPASRTHRSSRSCRPRTGRHQGGARLRRKACRPSTYCCRVTIWLDNHLSPILATWKRCKSKRFSKKPHSSAAFNVTGTTDLHLQDQIHLLVVRGSDHTVTPEQRTLAAKFAAQSEFHWRHEKWLKQVTIGSKEGLQSNGRYLGRTPSSDLKIHIGAVVIVFGQSTVLGVSAVFSDESRELMKPG